ncbi:MAG: ABC transporter ATP-binding protein [Thermoproteota archaeon]
MADVSIYNLTKRFGSVVAVNNLSLDIQDGEFTVLLGPSGCGKTTTLRCVAGLEHQDSGDIIIDGKNVNTLSPSERDIAMVFQFPVLYPGLNVEGNLSFPLKQRKMSKNEITHRVKYFSEILGIKNLLKKDVSKLNAGERQLVALGRALVRDPKILLLDEALTNLSTSLKLSMITQLKKLHKELSLTAMYVTHDQYEAMLMADKIGVMNKGELLQYDIPTAVYNKPRDVFVASFIGTPPMNLIDAVYDKNQVQIRFNEKAVLDISKDYRLDLISENLSSEIILGVRPEEIKLHKDCGQDNHMKGIIDTLEFTVEGSAIIDITLEDNSLRSRLSEIKDYQIGDRTCVIFEKIYIFDRSTQKLIGEAFARY